uniref:Uncharacterized protein n=1 Tax=Anguilla anguilla TaxID=7936 RepID=A0A0E9QBB4_ANGAN
MVTVTTMPPSRGTVERLWSFTTTQMEVSCSPPPRTRLWQCGTARQGSESSA